MKSIWTSTFSLAAHSSVSVCVILLAPGTQWSQNPIEILPAALAVRTNGAAIMVADAAAVVAMKRLRVILFCVISVSSFSDPAARAGARLQRPAPWNLPGLFCLLEGRPTFRVSLPECLILSDRRASPSHHPPPWSERSVQGCWTQIFLCVPRIASLGGFAKIQGEALVRALQMLAHRRPCPLWIVRGNRITNNPVLRLCRVPGARGFEMPGEPFEVGIDALVEQLADAAHEHSIAQRCCDGNVELTIELNPRVPRWLRCCRLAEHGIQPRDIVSLGQPGSFLRHGTFDERAGVQ